ncbi:hypothetical protein [Sphingobacterium sp.]|uniref:hypothetical protein n=1 Tax=Sphingobacterium sp. TaxID=341027 RepID=UPI002898B658|nr:hypothetical protein [Sphingobacterium sp.]
MRPCCLRVRDGRKTKAWRWEDALISTMFRRWGEEEPNKCQLKGEAVLNNGQKKMIVNK